MSSAKGRAGWRLYARLTRHLLDHPSTTAEVVQALGTHLVATRLLLRRMHALGMIHICEWPASPKRHLRVPKWAFGVGPDCAAPPTAIANDGAKLQPNSELIAYRSMLRELSHGPCTGVMLAGYCGTDPTWAEKFLKFAHGIKLVRIADWHRQLRGGQPARMFAFSPTAQADEPRPAPMSRKLIDRRNKAKRKARDQQQAILRAIAPNASIFTLAA